MSDQPQTAKAIRSLTRVVFMIALIVAIIVGYRSVTSGNDKESHERFCADNVEFDLEMCNE